MKHVPPHSQTPRLHRRPLAALAPLLVLLCSCRSVAPGKPAAFGEGDQGALQLGGMAQRGTLPPQAWTGAPGDGYTIPAGARPRNLFAALGIPLPQTILAPWAPPAIAGPWPHDEYLLDGGDREAQVTVTKSGRVNGLELEDTVAHYDTIDGRTIVKPSNRVCIYSPRFGAVRKVSSVQQSDQFEQVVEAEKPLRPGREEEIVPATTVVQPLQPLGEVAVRPVSVERLRQQPQPTITRIAPGGVEGSLKAYENFTIIRHGIFQAEEKARLAIAVDAAITWSHDLGVQVILDKLSAVETSDVKRAQQTFTVDVPNKPCLRVIKVASTNVAKPGDIVEFTLRFDNIGDQAIGNVTLIDNLTTRLEYVQGSAQTSRAADFSTQINEGDSLVLRWQFTDPLPANQGGVVRFNCRVR